GRPESLGKAFHIFNDHPLLLSDLVSQMRELGYQIKRLKYDEWRAEQAHLFERSSEASDVQALALIFPQENRSAGADGDSGASGPDFDDQNTREGLAGTAIVCPRITSELLRTYFSYFIHKGFLEAPEQLKVK
ncbi:MAG: hypothetical protein ACJ8AG_04650, partial [Ktedonobacteraceae bacterium]